MLKKFLEFMELENVGKGVINTKLNAIMSLLKDRSRYSDWLRAG
jgi:hypothetical protein